MSDTQGRFSRDLITMRGMIETVAAGGVLDAAPEVAEMARQAAAAIGQQQPMDEDEIREWAIRLAAEWAALAGREGE